jgi:hypothetical protein
VTAATRTDREAQETAMDERLLERMLDEPLDWRFKSLPATAGTLTLAKLGAQGWNALTGDLPLPLMLLKEPALAQGPAKKRARLLWSSWPASHNSAHAQAGAGSTKSSRTSSRACLSPLPPF